MSQNLSVLDRPQPTMRSHEQADPLVIFARGIRRIIHKGEEVSIPPELRGIDPHTGRIRSSYAAKAHLKFLTQRMFG